jgi:predicted Ser/Thr protein kinase
MERHEPSDDRTLTPRPTARARKRTGAGAGAVPPDRGREPSDKPPDAMADTREMDSLVSVPAAAEIVGSRLGRFQILGELGSGGMGIVYAAIDPDLRRRIALKLLRDVANREAKDRLLREARAMARLAHPNVVTVYEVGTIGGRDFIAMEMIRGESLMSWLRANRRTPADVVDAFIAAGRGLAAAHAAGIVHRDFKPHNVLRSAAGRITVTDFGLARQSDDDAPLGMLSTLRGLPLDDADSLTEHDVVIGTPPYMAPEQWSRSAAITPAADQFAYCVALWEALTGVRPYVGTTLDDLRDRIERGPAALDASKIPRALRELLRRGLEPAAAARWPSMDALITRLEHTRRAPKYVHALAELGLAGVVVSSVITFADRSTPPLPPVPACADIDAGWSPVLADAFARATSDAHANVLATGFVDWQLAHTAACAAPPAIQRAQLQCLDGVREHLTLMRTVFASVPTASAEQLQALMLDPAICRKDQPQDLPRLTLAAGEDTRHAYQLFVQSGTEKPPPLAEIHHLIANPSADACARLIATLAFEATSQDDTERRTTMNAALAFDEACTDERVRADYLIRAARYHWEPTRVGRHGALMIDQAANAAARVLQPDLAAAIANLQAIAAAEAGQWDAALRLVDQAFAGYTARKRLLGQLETAIERDALRVLHGMPDDFTQVAEDADHWRAQALATHHGELARQLGVLANLARFRLGDVTAAHDELVRMWQLQPHAAIANGRRVTGTVVDARGQPIAGARVIATASFTADSAGIGLPLFIVDHFDGRLRDDTQRGAITDAHGEFAIEDAAPASVIAAQLDDRRSRPIAITDRPLRLALAPTRTLRGRVELGDTPYTMVTVFASDLDDPTGVSQLAAPVARDGSFTLAGASLGALRISAAVRDPSTMRRRFRYRALPAAPAAIGPIVLTLLQAPRALDVRVRAAGAAPLKAAVVTVLSGTQEIRSAGDVLRRHADDVYYDRALPVDEPATAPGVAIDRRDGADVAAHLTGLPAGELTVCAINYDGDWTDHRFLAQLDDHLAPMPFRCQVVDARAEVIELELEPTYAPSRKPDSSTL